jgi:hypothetical protein
MTFTEAREAESYAREQRAFSIYTKMATTAPIYLPDRRKG